MPSRECPICEQDKLVSPREAKLIFDVSKWGAHALLDRPEARLVCSWCRSIKLGDEWDRLMSVGERAYELADASSNREKDKEYYRDMITKDDPSARLVGAESDSHMPEPTGREW